MRGMQTMCQVAANPQTKPTDLSWESTDSMLTVYTHRHHLLLLLNQEAA